MHGVIGLDSEHVRASLLGLGLEELRVGRHIVRATDRSRIRDVHVHSVWLAAIEPSFHSAASLIVVHSDGLTQALFRPSLTGDDRTAPVVCPELDDELLRSVQSVDLAPTVGGLSLDGITYHLHIRTPAVSSDLTFGNPLTESLCAVERALFSVAAHVVGVCGSRQMRDYLTQWHDYLHRA